MKAISRIYASLILKELKTIEQVPAELQAEVRELIGLEPNPTTEDVDK